MLSICFTTYNRYEMLVEAFTPFLDDTRVEEIIIVDDCSDYEIFSKLHEHILSLNNNKVKLFRNPRNLGMSRNKATAIKYAKEGSWCAILDSDNIFSKEFLNTFFSQEHRHAGIIYSPDFAKPSFDYRQFRDMFFTRFNVASMLNGSQTKDMFNCLLNTCNYIVNREQYLRVYKYNEAHVASDTIWFNYNWLKEGYSIAVLPGMEYQHRVHDGSGFLNNVHYNMARAEEVRQLIIQL